MIIYPAIDLRGGRVVRLQQGDPDRETVYSHDPLDTALRWKDAGAEWIHVINLDGSLDAAGLNLEMLSRLARIGPRVQFGGGLRSVEDARLALDAGASRVIFGTIVVRLPYLAGEAVQEFGPEAVAVALDARDGRVATHGWKMQSAWMPVELGQRFAGMGVRYALYTDISRDGELQGVNVDATAALAHETRLSVIASGGVASLDDIRALKAVGGGIAGVVIGKALYTGAVALAEAIHEAQS